MGKRFRFVNLVLIMALLVQGLPWLPSNSAAAEEASPWFVDDFDGGLTRWDMFGSTAWQIQGTGSAAKLTGATTSTSPQRVVIKPSALPYTSADYAMAFDAQGDRFRVIFRYSSGTSHYFLEFKSGHWVEMWKYANSSTNVQVSNSVDIAAVLRGFNLADRHDYRLNVRGTEFSLAVDGTDIVSFNDSSLASGGVGFALKSVGPAVSLSVDKIQVLPAEVPSGGSFAIVHTPVTSVPYYDDLPIAFSLAGDAAGATATIHYGYGDGTPDRELTAIRGESGRYSGKIPGTNRASAILYYLTAEDGAGGTTRYPDTGSIVVPIETVPSYSNNFDGETVNTAPVGWTTGGSAKVVQLADGNKVFNLNGSGSAKLNLLEYRNADNFVVRFKVKYERTSSAVQNTWRFRYRSTDDANNNAIEWATHNSKYFLMRKTTLGGNYPIANYVQSLLGDWHDYELHVSGISHKLLIDGVETAGGDDSDPLAPVKGYFQWNVVGGINLMIDDFSIDPLPLPSIIDMQPSGNYSGIYKTGETPGLDLVMDAGASAHEIRIDYEVSRADGDRETVASETKTYDLKAYEQIKDTLPFKPGLSSIGTYDVKADFALDGETLPGLAKQMRIAIVSREGVAGELDLDNESKFGLNTHYALNWRDDIIDGARKMGAKHHRSGITWTDIDKNAKDGAGNTVYDYTGTDLFLNKLFGYGFNQITVLGIDQNGYYQSGIANTAPALRAMGDFVYRTVDRYKGRIRQWEMPNEPEIFAKPYVPEEFVQLQKIAYLNMKKADPDAMLLAGDHTSSVLSVLPKELALGSYDYADAYSFHPYVYNSMPDDNLPNLIGGVKGLVNAYGGWKDYYLTEGGWPTAKSGYPSVSEETQRDYIVRAFLTYLTLDQVKAYEYYDYKNDGTDDRYYDIFWGIADNNGRPKLAYAAVNQLMTSLERARYLGMWDAGDPNVAVHLFLEDGKPILTAWRKTDHKDDPAVRPPTSTLTLPFSSAGVMAKDINGVPISLAPTENVELTVSGSPVYLTGLPAGFVYTTASQLLASKSTEAASKLKALLTETNGELVDADLTALNELAAAFEQKTEGGGLSDEALEKSILEIYALMAQAAGQIGDRTLVRAQGYVALEALYNLAESASVALAYSKAEARAGANAIDYASATAAVTAAFETRKGEDGVMPVSAAAVLRMNRYGRLAETTYARGDYADSFAYNLLAREFANAAEAIVTSETPRFVGVISNLVPTQANGEAGYPNSFTLSLFNDTDIPRKVTLETRLPEGWAVSQTTLQTLELTVPALGTTNAEVQVNVPEDAVNGRYEIGFELTADGAVFETKKAQLTVEDGIGVRLVPVQKTIEELDVLTVELTGTSSASKSGNVTVIGPDGVPLAPASGSSFSELKKGDVLRLDFVWTDRERRSFNDYPVDVRVEATSSGKTLFRDASMPLDFNLIQKARGITIDGDLSDWQDAYPFHLRYKTQNSSGYHDPANLEATAYTMWENDGLLLAVSVRDNIHKQSENAANLWKNDSLQISLDLLNNRESPYGPDDVEWGFALTDTGYLLTNIFSSSAPNPNGDVSGQTPFAAMRDDASKRTLYELKIPSSHIRYLEPAVGGKIGLNVAVNDADLQNGRDDFIQWTKGTADSKNTSLYDSFLYIDDVPPDETAPMVRIVAPASVSVIERATLALEVEDGESGVESASIQLDGKEIASPYEVTPLSLKPGEHRLTADAADKAGNHANASATLMVTFRLEELTDLLRYGFEQGWIEDKGILQSLLTKATRLQVDASEDNRQADFKPLKQEIQAQSGKKLSTEFSSTLQELLIYLQEQET
ncbi:NEW3 domain-containing protein [Paenibacillus sp. KQZ6P-2]|uniref:NEW3 domain-containing protein n=1 Tax=Paenibacillus mangrovi TaxID=2931978 RepID=A0A9X2B4P4_9BACL|nr:sugar-binding protein [Paenibacillus mangrovi]MCJ8014746.1 NEW3 domain-containing protein [Paenibacillus mangrovi]